MIGKCVLLAVFALMSLSAQAQEKSQLEKIVTLQQAQIQQLQKNEAEGKAALDRAQKAAEAAQASALAAEVLAKAAQSTATGAQDLALVAQSTATGAQTTGNKALATRPALDNACVLSSGGPQDGCPDGFKDRGSFVACFQPDMTIGYHTSPGMACSGPFSDLHMRICCKK